MRDTLQEKIATASTLLDVLLILKDATKMDTHVATLAYVDSIYKPFNGVYSIVKCRPIPLISEQTEYYNYAYLLNDGSDLSKNQIVMIVYMDNNFINSLDSITMKQTRTRDLDCHSLTYGVIVEMNLPELSPEEREELLDF